MKLEDVLKEVMLLAVHEFNKIGSRVAWMEVDKVIEMQPDPQDHNQRVGVIFKLRMR